MRRRNLVSIPRIFLDLSWVCHVLGLDEGVEFFGGDITEFDGGFAEADLGVVGGFGDLGGVVVADFWSQGCDQHQRMMEVVIDAVAIGFDAAYAMFDETVAG